MLSFYNEEGNKVGDKEGLRVWVKDRLVALDGHNYLVLDYK